MLQPSPYIICKFFGCNKRKYLPGHSFKALRGKDGIFFSSLFALGL